MASANEKAFDAAVRHQVFLQRYGGSQARDVLKILKEAERDLVKRLRAQAGSLARSPARGEIGAGLTSSRRLEAMLAEIRQQSKDVRRSLEALSRGSLRSLAEAEVDISTDALNGSVGVDIGVTRPSPELLRAIVDGPLVRGRTLRQWYTRLEDGRFNRLEAAVRLGLVEGDTIPQMVARFRAAEDVTRRSAVALVRTSVNAVANQARTRLYEANEDVIEGMRWVSTLDGRTSPICQARDGMVWPLGQPHPKPPAHPNCRSTLTPVIKGWDDLAEPGALKRGRGAKDIDRLFRKRLRDRGWPANRVNAAVLDGRSSLNGVVPSKTTYQDWLRRQPASFQDGVLGPTKGKLFRRGGVTLDRFVDLDTGRPFDLDELRSQNARAWRDAELGDL